METTSPNIQLEWFEFGPNGVAPGARRRSTAIVLADQYVHTLLA
jgi:hypothetical protein